MMYPNSTIDPSGPTSGVSSGKSLLYRWTAAGVLIVGILIALTIGVWPASAADKARADGEQFGEAVSALYTADTQGEIDTALGDIDTAVTQTREHAGDEVADQVADQQDALDRAADGFAGTVNSDTEFEQDLYQSELDTAVDDLTRHSDDFRTQGPEVRQAFWGGYETGFNVD